MEQRVIRNFVFLLLLITVPNLVTAQSPSRSPTRVLFIGNSFTYFNNMPHILEAIAASQHGPVIQAQLIAVGGASLKDHWEDGKAVDAINSGHFDYVVLNEQSALSDVLIVNQKSRVAAPDTFWKYAGLFDTAIRKSGARTVLLMTWKDAGAPERDQQALDYAFADFAKKHDSVLAPVSVAWTRLRKNLSINLYFEDQHHPSTTGSYLEACVLYATVTGKSPVGAASSVTGTPIENDDGKVLAGKTTMLVDLPREQAREIQQTAWDVVQEFARSGGHPPVVTPSPIDLPKKGKGQRPMVTELAGNWHGTLRFYPGSEPTEMALSIDATSSQPKARLKIFYKGARPDVDVELTDFIITSDGVAFTDPLGPNKSAIKFDGAFNPGVLSGTATALKTDSDPKLAVYGTWTVSKVVKQSAGNSNR
jgi:hypothetical protein